MKRVRWNVLQGVNETLFFNWISGGVAVDFTGCTARLALRVKPDDTTPALSVSTTSTSAGVITLGTPLNALGVGLVQVDLFAAGTVGLVSPVYRGELLVTFTDGLERAFVALDVFVRNRSTF
jgi:hypothetical protein